MEQEQEPQFWRKSKVCEATGLGKSTIDLYVKTKDFPKPIRLGTQRAVVFVAQEVRDWIKAKIKERDDRRDHKAEK